MKLKAIEEIDSKLSPAISGMESVQYLLLSMLDEQQYVAGRDL